MNIKKFGNILYGICIAVLITVAGTVAISALNIPNGIKLFTVQSGSMEPAIKTGSIVIIKPANEYQVNDILTFKSENDINNKNPKVTTTHRLVEKLDEGGQLLYRTKGDANDAPDGTPVKAELVLGKVLFSVPLLGYPVAFARTEMGLIFLIIIPATLIVYSELVNIKNEAKRLISERKKRKLNLAEKVEVAIGEEEMKLEEEIKGLIKK